MRTLFTGFKHLIVLIGIAFAATSCNNDEPESKAPVADFTFEIDASDPLKVHFTNTSENATQYLWDFGDDNGTSTDESPSYTYATGGTYNISLTVTGEGGTHEVTKEVVVTGPVDLIVGGIMEDESAWTVTTANLAEQTAVEFVDGKVVFTNTKLDGGTKSNIQFWQAVEVEAGDYIFSAHVEGSGMGSNTWFQVCFGTTEPVEGGDYNDGSYTGLNGSEGCGGGSFHGDLAVLGCDPSPGTGQGGLVSFAEPGTVYVVFKAGSWDGYLGDGGIKLDNVSLIKK